MKLKYKIFIELQQSSEIIGTFVVVVYTGKNYHKYTKIHNNSLFILMILLVTPKTIFALNFLQYFLTFFFH